MSSRSAPSFEHTRFCHTQLNSKSGMPYFPVLNHTTLLFLSSYTTKLVAQPLCPGSVAFSCGPSLVQRLTRLNLGRISDMWRNLRPGREQISSTTHPLNWPFGECRTWTSQIVMLYPFVPRPKDSMGDITSKLI